MSLSASLVLTSINDLRVLDEYFENFRKYEHLSSVEVIAIPDLKTPTAAFERCSTLKQFGLSIRCPTIEEQEVFLRKIGFPPHFIPVNSDNRRNVGYLMALETGTDFVISIDDDNFCLPEDDFFLDHAVVCDRKYLSEVVNAPQNWFNICDLLSLDRPGKTYPRGYPYYARHRADDPQVSDEICDIHINAGLWLGDPDVDGISWLVAPARSIGYSGKSIVLSDQTWSPVNTQNTALRRDCLAAYYFVKMGYPLAGMPIDRYGDIFSGYFVQACAKHLGGTIRVGTPLADHRRNSHNYLKDASNEWACIIVLEDLLPWLTEVKLQGTTYSETYTSLAFALEDQVEKMTGGIWNDATRGYFHQIASYMRQWAKISAQFL